MNCPQCGEPSDRGHVCAALLAATMPMPRGTASATAHDAPTQPAAESAAPDAATRVTADPLLPDSIEGYRLGFVIGTGGMATVYQAERAGERAAIKVPKLRSSDARTLARAVREAKAAAAVRHPNVVAVKGAGLLPDGRPYLITELLEGEPLDVLLDRDRHLPWPAAVAVLHELAQGLEAVHAQGVVHRDLKPGNVFIAREGDAVRAKLIDFGLALLGEPGQRLPQTDVNRAPGTAEYVAPEQARGAALDARADLYAFGVTAFELLTGTLPFVADTQTGVLRLHVGTMAPSLQGRRDLPTPLSALVDALLSKRVDERPGSAAQVRAVLERLPSPDVDAPGLMGEQLHSWRQRQRAALPWWRRLLRRVPGV